MTKREREILEILRKNPLISQEDLAQDLGLARSSVAIHIASLIDKGYLLGRGYILAQDPGDVVVLGGAGMDLVGYPQDQLKPEDSSPGLVETTIGGVGLNIAENLACLGQRVHFISAVGGDKEGELILESLARSGVGIDHVDRVPGQATSKYLALLDHQADLAFALSDMRIMDQITVADIEKNRLVLDQARLLVADTNLPEAVLAFLASRYGSKLYVDPVSTSKSRRIQVVLGLCRLIKPNLLEASLLSGMEIRGEEDLVRAGQALLDQGVQELLLSAGAQGAYYFTGSDIYRAQAQEAQVVNATGAGDAFMAGFIHGQMQDLGPADKCRLATAASLAVLKKEAANLAPQDLEEVEKLMEDVSVWKI